MYMSGQHVFSVNHRNYDNKIDFSPIILQCNQWDTVIKIFVVFVYLKRCIINFPLFIYCRKSS